VDLGHKKYSIRRRRDLGSQWERKERAVAVKSIGNFPFFLGFGDSLASSLELGKVSKSVGCSGESS
jgi:hypothetical protein